MTNAFTYKFAFAIRHNHVEKKGLQQMAFNWKIGCYLVRIGMCNAKQHLIHDIMIHFKYVYVADVALCSCG